MKRSKPRVVCGAERAPRVRWCQGWRARGFLEKKMSITVINLGAESTTMNAPGVSCSEDSVHLTYEVFWDGRE